MRLSRLLDEILDISRLESGTTNLCLEDLDVDEAIEAAFDTVAVAAQAAGVKMDAGEVPDGLQVRANADRLRQVLVNVLPNGVKHNWADDPEIYVHTEVNGNEVFIDGVDNGGGVSREDAATVFEKFARGSTAGRQ